MARHIAYERLRASYWSAGDLGDGRAWRVSSQDTDSRKPRPYLTVSPGRPPGNRIAFRYMTRDKSDRTEIMVESCDLSGAVKTTILQDNHLSAFTWTPSGRFIYSRNTEAGSAESDNLWELKVDAQEWNSAGQSTPVDGLVGIFRLQPQRDRRWKATSFSERH